MSLIRDCLRKSGHLELYRQNVYKEKSEGGPGEVTRSGLDLHRIQNGSKMQSKINITLYLTINLNNFPQQ